MNKLLALGLIGLGCIAASCSDDYYYEHADDGRPEYEYLTTIPAEQFANQAVGFGWQRTATRIINEEGYADVYEYPKDHVMLSPSHYYFTTDSVTQFTFNGTDSISRCFPYTYDERTNMLNSDGLGYMQLTKLSSTKMCIVEKFYEDNIHVFFAETTYERILPFDMYDYWNNYKPLNP